LAAAPFFADATVNQPGSVIRPSLGRLNAIADAVIAVAMTLLMLNVGIPENHNFSRDGLLKFLAGIESDLVIYAATRHAPELVFPPSGIRGSSQGGAFDKSAAHCQLNWRTGF
jgi:transmembrane protein TMEM174 (potassium channel)